MINIFLILSILVWPFGQLLQITPFGLPLRLQLLDVISALLSLSLIVSSRQKIIKDPLFKPLAIFCVIALISLVANFHTISLVSLAYCLRFISYTSFYFAFRLEGVKKYSRYLFLSAAIFVTFGLLQYLFLPDVRFLKYLGFDDHYYRLIGSLLDPNYAGLVLVIFTLLAPKLLFFVPLLALVLTFSRASFLSLAAGLLYLGFVKKQFKLLLVLLVLGVFLYFVPKPFGEGVNLLRTFSIVSRIENQKSALSLFSQNPIIGVGFNNLKIQPVGDIPNLSSGVDNSFIFVLATTGILGFLAFLNLLITFWRLLITPAQKACFIALMVHSLINNSFFYSWILVVFFVVVSTKKSV